MTKVAIKVLPHGKNLPLPEYATPDAAGVDLYAAIDTPVVLGSLERQLIPTGISIALPRGHEAQIRPRSGLAMKFGLSMVNTPGTIDADYRGEIGVLLVNLSKEPVTIEPKTRIAQMIIGTYKKVEWHKVDELDSTQRAGKGFGSTGK